MKRSRLDKFYFIVFFCCLLFTEKVFPGTIEDCPDKTIIHLTAFGLPTPTKTNTAERAEYQCLLKFIDDFPRLFEKKYRAKYEANPEKYGRHNWKNLELQMRPATGIQMEGVETDLLAIAGGMSPDILYINFRKSDNYIRNNFLYPLDKPEDGYFSAMPEEEINARIYPAIWPVIKREGPNGEEHIWAMPYGGILGKVLFYRKELFDERNIPYPDDKWTWNDMFLAAKKITDPPKGIYGILLGRGKHESWYWCSYLWSAGGECMEYDKTSKKWKCVFGSRQAAVALDFYTKLCTETWTDSKGVVRHGYSSKDAGESHNKWDRGEIGMMDGYIDEKLFANINPDLVGMAPLPLGPTGKRGGEINSRMMGLFSGIKDVAVRDAAWEYLKFISSMEAEKIRTKVMVEGGLGRFVNPKYLTMFGYPEIVRMSPKGWAEVFDIAIKSGRPEPYGKNSNFAYDMMTVPIQKAEELALAGKLPENDEERLKFLQNLLEEQNKRANEVMIGEITPREKSLRRGSALLFLTAIIVAFTILFRKIIKIFTPVAASGEGLSNPWDIKKYKWAYIILVPAALSVLLWQYIPLARGSIMAFMDYKIVGKSSFVWLDNLGDILFDAYWWAAIWNSLRYSFLVIAMTFIPPIILAILLQEIPKGSLLFRIIFYLPAINTGIVTLLLWKQFYEPSEKGMLNMVFLNIPGVVYVLAGLFLLILMFAFARRLALNDMYFSAVCFALVGIMLFTACLSLAAPIFILKDETFFDAIPKFAERLFSMPGESRRWLGDPRTALVACIIPALWAGMGPGCLIYLAALKGIPEDYYEAADMDGANTLDKILFIVFPMLKALIVINFVGVFINSWYSSADNVLALTGGSAGTEVAGLHIWYKAFTFLNFGQATAMAWMLGFMLIGFTVYQLQMLSKIEFKTAKR